MESKSKSQTTKDVKSVINYGIGRLFIDQLKNILWSERVLEKLIQKMVRNAGSPNLILIFKDHDNLAQERVKRLENVFESIDIRASGKKCEGMVGLIRECENILEDTKQGPVRDAGMIAAFQKILHYKMSAYSTIVAYCPIPQKEYITEILKLTLAEDRQTDSLLSDAAYNTINYDAAIDENKVLASHYNRK